MKKKDGLRVALYVTFGILLSVSPLFAADTKIITTKHNLSATGPGEIKALTETRVCIFCHTPHNAKPYTPLWNRDVGSQNYILYTSSTINATPSQPNGPSRLCLSCHDGTIALGAVLQPAGGINMTREITLGSPSNIGGNLLLTGDHPFSFSYYKSITNPGIFQTPPTDMLFYTIGGNAGYIECSTCHDPHEDRYRSLDKNGQLTGKFLVVDTRGGISAFCLKCHNLPNWIGSAHQQSTAPVDPGKFPVSPMTWPTWDTVGKWGCAICHTSHSSKSGQWLLYYATEAEVCFPCHGATPPPGDPMTAAAAVRGAKNITAQTQKISSHKMSMTPSRNDPKKLLFSLQRQTLSREVTCADCHDPHVMTKGKLSEGRDGRVRGSIKGVSGVDRNGVTVRTASYEYEVCFKCHSDYGGQFPFVPRVVNTTNTRLEFDTTNPSFHPVIERGRTQNVPSIPSSYEPALTVSSMIYCTDCHSDDTGSKGPHGSAFAPILRERYETADNTPENYQNYALCYRCHERNSILADASFRKKSLKTTQTGGGHSGHLAKGAPCSACHDAHGVNIAPGTGDHTRLINFDTRIVLPRTGSLYPLFNQRGTFSGSCTLVCHGRSHMNESYP